MPIRLTSPSSSINDLTGGVPATKENPSPTLCSADPARGSITRRGTSINSSPTMTPM
jgi:hypothetical protein